MNDHERERIAAAINQLRPDWPAKSLVTLLSKPELATRPRRDVTVALAWVACETSTATPARVLEAGPWWRAAAVEGQARTREVLQPIERCKTCGHSRTTCEQNPWNRDKRLGHAFEPDIKHPRDVDLSPVVADLKGRVTPAQEATS